MQRVRVKICGITSLADAMDAVACGADAIGLVFYAASPRAVDLRTARGIAEQLPPFVSKVGLFVDAATAIVDATLREVPLDLLQFHGSETPAACRAAGRPYIKAIRMQADTGLAELSAAYHDATGLLLDTYVPGVAGGTGQTFDWDLIPKRCPKPIILAGGLTPANVAAAIKQVNPYAVDVSGGVELRKGVKDLDKIRSFMERVGYAKCD